MKELESYLNRICRAVGGTESLRKHVREEIEEHLLATVERYEAEGIPREEAARKAIEEFGGPENIGKELHDVHDKGLMALIVARAMEWKEQTMKTGWKWSFVAHFLLVAVIALEIAFGAFYADTIAPQVKYYMEMHSITPGGGRPRELDRCLFP